MRKVMIQYGKLAGQQDTMVGLIEINESQPEIIIEQANNQMDISEFSNKANYQLAQILMYQS